MHQRDTSSSVMCAIFSAFKCKAICNGHEEEQIKTKGYKILFFALHFVDMSRCNLNSIQERQI
jgi:hypothetical protein